MPIKLIVTDLDNTLLRRDKTVSNYTVDVFKRLCDLGILVAFATARDFRFITEHISPLTAIKPDIIISDNGALACHNGVDIYKRMIPRRTIKALIPQFNSVRCVSTEYAYYLSGEYSNDHWSIGKRETILFDFLKDIDSDAFYLDGSTDKSSVSLTECYPDIRAVTYSDVNLITLVHHEATKLNALNAVINALNIEMSDIVVFGDDYSDIDVLSNYENSVAVANAIDECKAVANCLCDDCDNDGVAKWLEERIVKWCSLPT